MSVEGGVLYFRGECMLPGKSELSYLFGSPATFQTLVAGKG